MEGLWRANVSQVVDDHTVKVIIPRINPDRGYTCEQLPDTLVAGDRVLVGFAEGRPDRVEIVRKLL